MRQGGCCSMQNNNHCTTTFKPNNQEYLGLNEMKIKQCLRQSNAFRESEKSETEFVNPMLTQDSRNKQSKIFSTYCETQKRGLRNSTSRKVPTSRDAHSVILDKQD